MAKTRWSATSTRYAPAGGLSLEAQLPFFRTAPRCPKSPERPPPHFPPQFGIHASACPPSEISNLQCQISPRPDFSVSAFSLQPWPRRPFPAPVRLSTIHIHDQLFPAPASPLPVTPCFSAVWLPASGPRTVSNRLPALPFRHRGRPLPLGKRPQEPAAGAIS